MNAGGTRKLAGIGQRVIHGGAHVGTVVVVEDAESIRDVLEPVYAALELDWDPATVGRWNARGKRSTTRCWRPTRRATSSSVVARSRNARTWPDSGSRPRPQAPLAPRSPPPRPPPAARPPAAGRGPCRGSLSAGRPGSPRPWRGRRGRLTNGSSRPWITVVGTRTECSPAVRSPEARSPPLAAGAGGVVVALVGRGGQFADARLVERKAGRRDHLDTRDEVVDEAPAVAGRPAQQHAPAALRPARRPVPRSST